MLNPLVHQPIILTKHLIDIHANSKMCQINILTPSNPLYRRHVYLILNRDTCPSLSRLVPIPRSRLALFKDVEHLDITKVDRPKVCRFAKFNVIEVEGECWTIARWAGVRGAPCAVWERRKVERRRRSRFEDLRHGTASGSEGERMSPLIEDEEVGNENTEQLVARLVNRTIESVVRRIVGDNAFGAERF